MGEIAVRTWRSCSAFVPLLFLVWVRIQGSGVPNHAQKSALPVPVCFHGSCRENRGHMFQNHNLARLKAGLRSTLWWNMWLSCIACMMVSKWNLADSDGLMAFNIVFLLPLSRFAKDDPAVSDCFFADGRGEAHISCTPALAESSGEEPRQTG